MQRRHYIKDIINLGLKYYPVLLTPTASGSNAQGSGRHLTRRWRSLFIKIDFLETVSQS